MHIVADQRKTINLWIRFREERINLSMRIELKLMNDDRGAGRAKVTDLDC